ncbi:phenylacetate-CoA oxygenase subunit PaaJ [Streptomyces sp. HNM0575]|uniref:1,2-phenylacetyl-CoA epoxidase subunit PaaD n=1 Tax=Streptomyces sp. HNM0575 TaxID=2716338 RepID=UPI00145E82A0|nr:1,2-phenylacetyl-CoA epoxidase subunit PaaD [Streptomyces sp. HNM0575]NLU76035.1 phenylacetate-CoA oxygenase subunit PaaJ [Streptomyces sp. HNM0575]
MVTGSPGGAGTRAEPEAGRRQRELELEAWAGSVPDPELPVVTLAELGVLRRVSETAPRGPVEVELTPTYTGCPAVEAMTADIERVLRGHGVPEVTVRVVLTPPWSTDDISDEGRRKLAAHGIAPPRAGAGAGGRGGPGSGPVPLTLAIRCPQCGSTETTLLSRFSSTACKALRRCESCLEPFDHFKEV